ncbi:MAG: hypothetical protein CBB68_02405 [Rhodospirillaceae bacterium TMED8]|nr:hypothetical protein [Magnetovibrio sp.]OUT52227.1 MAG: hypothetical protein CBB68_02405 [Rhodospirillaceae bacterium TMED8]
MRASIQTLVQCRLTGWLCAVGVVVVWSGWLVVSRLGVVQNLTIYDLMMLRFSFALGAVTPLLWRYWPRHLKWWQIALFSVGQGVPYLGLAFGGFQFAPASHAGVMMNGTLPIIVALIGWVWLKEKPILSQIFGMVIILLGCGLIALDRGVRGVEHDVWIGHLMFIGASSFVAFNLVFTKVWNLTALQAVVLMPSVNLAWFGPIYLAVLPSALREAQWQEIVLQGIYQGFGPSFVGVFLFTTAIRVIGTASTAAVMALVPAMAALIAIPVLNEWPSSFVWVGIAVVTAGIVLATHIDKKY